jgi:cobalt/nickel transport system permease protein
MRKIFNCLDPRARLLTVFAAILIVTSTPLGVLWPFAPYFALSLLLISMSSASGHYVLWRCLVASPFILLAAGLLAFQAGLTAGGRPIGLEAAISVALKGYTAALLLAFLTATTPLSELLWALRRLKAPESLNMILALMYRYVGLLTDEHARLERARESRTVRPLGKLRFHVYGRQLGSLVLRSWDRADRIHAAMVSRGYNGFWPLTISRPFGLLDATFVVFSSLLFLIARIV